ncbi:MAG TPA: HAD hydrolase-like protein [Acetobacteraceae bacterium]
MSVDAARAYKASPAAYALMERATGVPPGETLFVSSNGFDVAGAKRFGFQVAWVRRGGEPGPVHSEAGPGGMFAALRQHPEELDAGPDYVLHLLTEVAGLG